MNLKLLSQCTRYDYWATFYNDYEFIKQTENLGYSIFPQWNVIYSHSEENPESSVGLSLRYIYKIAAWITWAIRNCSC